MSPGLSDLWEETQLAARSLIDYGDALINPTVRLGVTGLSRAGKTVFITALVHGLLRGGRFPVFEALAGGRIASARLEPQPDDTVARFDYENHLRALIDERRWPASTVDISELRLVIDYQRRNGATRSLTLDIADYPGEWLLDLPLLDKSFEQWSAESLALSRDGPRLRLAGEWHAHLATPDGGGQGRRTGGADRGKTVHRLPESLPRRTLRHEPVAARALPAAGQRRRLAGADVCAARRAARRRSAIRFALGDDAAALRFLCVGAGAPVLPRSFCAARPADRAGRCAGRAQCRAGRAARPASGADLDPRLLSRRQALVLLVAVSPAHRPHPVCGDQGRSPAPPEPRPAGGDRRAYGAAGGGTLGILRC